MRLLLPFFLLISTFLSAQIGIGTKGVNDYAIVLIAEEEVEYDLINQVKKSKTARDFDFYLFSNEHSVVYIKDSLNRLLNTNSSVNKSHLYLLVVGDAEWISNHTQMSNKLFAHQLIVSLDSSIRSIENYQVIQWESLQLDQLLQELKKKRQYQFVIDGIKWANQYDISRKKEQGIGIRTGLNIITGSQLDEDGYLPDTYFDYAINYFRIIKNRWRLNSEVAFTFKRPNPQKLIQDQIRSQVDVSSILSGSSINQDVHLNLEIIGRFGFQLSTDFYYFLDYKKKFNPYVGAGIGIGVLASFKGAIDTTINIDIDSGGGFDRSAISGDQNQDLNDADIQETAMLTPSINLSLGFQQELGEKMSFDLSAKYLFDLKTIRGSEQHMNRLTINTGLIYKLSGRKKTIYKYF